jgi:hypothetical protein
MMPEIDGLADDEVLKRQPQGRPTRRIKKLIREAFREATIVSTPADTSEGVMVVIPSFKPHIEHGPCPWSAHFVDGDTYATPSDGDRALVVVSEDQNPWVIEWWPYD